MSENEILDELNDSNTANKFDILIIGVFACGAYSLLESILFQIYQDFLILYQLKPTLILWFTNILTSLSLLSLIYIVLKRVDFKNRTHNYWKKMRNIVLRLFIVTLVVQGLFQLFWDTLLPYNFFILFDDFNLNAGNENFIYNMIPTLFIGFDFVIIYSLIRNAMK